MRFGSVLALLLLGSIGLAGTLHLLSSGEEPTAFVSKTRAAIGQARNVSLEQAADYWLATANKQNSGKDVRGSGAALAVAVQLGRIEALRSGTKPVPDRLKRLFQKHYSQKVLDEARWLVAEPGSRLGRVLARWPVKEGAVTLGNVIVFKTESGSKNRGLFAHELAHVEQYDELGIGQFARRYAADPEPIEEEARKKSRRVMRSL